MWSNVMTRNVSANPPSELSCWTCTPGNCQGPLNIGPGRSRFLLTLVCPWVFTKMGLYWRTFPCELFLPDLGNKDAKKYQKYNLHLGERIFHCFILKSEVLPGLKIYASFLECIYWWWAMMTTAMMDLFSTAGFSTLISWLTLGDVSTAGTLPHKPSNSTGHWACVFFLSTHSLSGTIAMSLTGVFVHVKS